MDETAPARPDDAESRGVLWEGVHDSKDVDGVSWWQSVPDLSLGLVDASGALATVRGRLGAAGRDVVLEVADVLDLRPGRRFALWHDRAVYHFLTEPDERADYLASLERCLRPGGSVVVSTFGPDGPTTCSGLPIVRYTHAELAAEFPGYELVATSGEHHITPWGTDQQFTAVLLRAPAGPAEGR